MTHFNGSNMLNLQVMFYQEISNKTIRDFIQNHSHSSVISWRCQVHDKDPKLLELHKQKILQTALLHEFLNIISEMLEVEHSEILCLEDRHARLFDQWNHN